MPHLVKLAAQKLLFLIEREGDQHLHFRYQTAGHTQYLLISCDNHYKIN